MTNDFIPLVDLEPWFAGDDADRRSLAATVDAHSNGVVSSSW